MPNSLFNIIKDIRITCEDYNINQLYMSILIAIVEHPDQTPGKLTNMVGCMNAQMSRAIRLFIKRKWITAELDSDDKRKIRLKPTMLGVKTASEIQRSVMG